MSWVTTEICWYFHYSCFSKHLTSHACALLIDNVGNYLYMYLNNGSFKSEVDPHQFNLRERKKIFKSWQVCDWLAKWLIVLGFMDLRWPRVYRRSNVGLVHYAVLTHQHKFITDWNGITFAKHTCELNGSLHTCLYLWWLFVCHLLFIIPGGCFPTFSGIIKLGWYAAALTTKQYGFRQIRKVCKHVYAPWISYKIELKTYSWLSLSIWQFPCMDIVLFSLFTGFQFTITNHLFR